MFYVCRMNTFPPVSPLIYFDWRWIRYWFSCNLVPPLSSCSEVVKIILAFPFWLKIHNEIAYIRRARLLNLIFAQWHIYVVKAIQNFIANVKTWTTCNFKDFNLASFSQYISQRLLFFHLVSLCDHCHSNANFTHQGIVLRQIT